MAGHFGPKSNFSLFFVCVNKICLFAKAMRWPKIFESFDDIRVSNLLTQTEKDRNFRTGIFEKLLFRTGNSTRARNS